MQKPILKGSEGSWKVLRAQKNNTGSIWNTVIRVTVLALEMSTHTCYFLANSQVQKHCKNLNEKSSCLET